MKGFKGKELVSLFRTCEKQTCLLFLIFLGSFLRLYRLEELMTYLGDEGRDMLIVMDIIKGRNLPLIGPPTSVVDLYLGSLYYYFITPFVWIFRMNPIGAAVFVAILGILTIPLIYWIGRKFFNPLTGFLAAIFYTLSPLTVKFARSSWNPNPMPFFTICLIICLLYFFKTKKTPFLYGTIVAFSIMLQLHYIVILLIPFLIFIIWQLGRKFIKKKTFLISLLIFFCFISPLILFDLKHNFVNTKGILTIFRSRSGEGFSLFDLLSRARDRLRQLISLFVGFSERDWKTNIISTVLIGMSIIGLLHKKTLAKIFVFSFFLWGIIGVGLYRHSFYPHYLGFLFPFPALLLGIIFAYFYQQSKPVKFFSFLVLLLLCFNMLKMTWKDLSHPSVLNIKLVQKIVRLIQQESQNQSFNFALLAENNYDDSYRYFFKLWNIPAAYQTEVTRQLFVVCEDQNICQPEGNPKWEIALFDAAYNGNIKLDGKWQPDSSITVFKFIPN